MNTPQPSETPSDNLRKEGDESMNGDDTCLPPFKNPLTPPEPAPKAVVGGASEHPRTDELHLLAHCGDAECETCSKIVCPHGEPLHFHHDGCPSCVTWEQMTAELEQLKRANGEMREALSEISTHLNNLHQALRIAKQNVSTDDDKSYWEHEITAHLSNVRLIHKALSSTPPTPTIPIDVAEKMYEALDDKILGQHWFEYLLIQFPATQGHLPLKQFFVRHQEALSLAKQHGLGKDK